MKELIVNRQSFIDYVNGILFERKGNHITALGDRIENTVAENALAQNKRVYLEEEGHIVSFLELDKNTNSFVEHPVKITIHEL